MGTAIHPPAWCRCIRLVRDSTRKRLALLSKSWCIRDRGSGINPCGSARYRLPGQQRLSGFHAGGEKDRGYADQLGIVVGHRIANDGLVTLLL